MAGRETLPPAYGREVRALDAVFVLLFLSSFALAVVLGMLQFLIARYLEDRVIRRLLLLPLPGLALMTGGISFSRFLHLSPSFLGPLFSDEFLLFLSAAIILAGILTGGGLGSRARSRG